MNKRLVLIILLCSAIGNVVGLDEKEDQCRPCDSGESFLRYLNLSFYITSTNKVKTMFIGAVLENNLEVVRDTFCWFMGNNDDYHSINKQALEIAIEEGYSEIVEFIVRSVKFEGFYDGIFFIDKLIENEHKHKNPVDLVKVMEKCGVLPYRIRCDGKLMQSKYLEHKSKSKVVQYVMEHNKLDMKEKITQLKKRV